MFFETLFALCCGDAFLQGQASYSELMRKWMGLNTILEKNLLEAAHDFRQWFRSKPIHVLDCTSTSSVQNLSKSKNKKTMAKFKNLYLQMLFIKTNLVCIIE